MMWLVENQFGRRNLTPYVRSELALTLEGLIRQQAKERQRAAGGDRGNQHSGGKPAEVQNSAQPAPVDTGKTRTQLAQKAGVSHDTIDKVRVIDKGAPEQVKQLLRSGDVTEGSRCYTLHLHGEIFYHCNKVHVR